MVDVVQASFKAFAVGAILIVWAEYTKDTFKFAWHIISTSPEEETWKAITKAVCGNWRKLYDSDEYGLIHATNLCEACR